MPAAIHRPQALADPARIRTLAGIDFDNPALRSALDRVAERTAHCTGMPISLIALVLDTALLIVGSTGLDGSWIGTVGGVPVEWSFCADTVTTGLPYILPDTSSSPHAGSPLVTIDGFASAAGVPITLAGHTVGAHCIIGVAVHPFTAADLNQLFTASAQITSLLQKFSTSTSD